MSALTGNLWSRWRSTIPTDAQLVGTVAHDNGDGTLRLTMPAGGTLTVRAAGIGAVVGNDVLVQGGAVIQVVESLTDYSALDAPNQWP